MGNLSYSKNLVILPNDWGLVGGTLFENFTSDLLGGLLDILHGFADTRARRFVSSLSLDDFLIGRSPEHKNFCFRAYFQSSCFERGIS